MRICLTIDGRRVCIEIPLLVQKWPPDPDPWLRMEELAINPEDLSLLATVDRLASGLRDDRAQGVLRAAVGEIAKGFESELPEGMQLVGARG